MKINILSTCVSVACAFCSFNVLGSNGGESDKCDAPKGSCLILENERSSARSSSTRRVRINDKEKYKKDSIQLLTESMNEALKQKRKNKEEIERQKYEIKEEVDAALRGQGIEIEEEDLEEAIDVVFKNGIEGKDIDDIVLEIKGELGYF